MSEAPRSRAPKTAQINRTRTTVIDATAALMVDSGYSSITIERIAAESGVARSTIYRHWENLEEIVFDAVQQLLGPVGSVPDNGTLRDDLVQLYSVLTRALTKGTWGKLVRGVVEAAMTEQMFADVLRQAIIDRREHGKAVLQRAIDRGDLPADTNMAWFLDSISGVIYYRIIMSGDDPAEPGMIEYLIDAAIAAAGGTSA